MLLLVTVSVHIFLKQLIVFSFAKGSRHVRSTWHAHNRVHVWRPARAYRILVNDRAASHLGRGYQRGTTRILIVLAYWVKKTGGALLNVQDAHVTIGLR